MEKSCCWNYLTAFSTPQHVIWDVKDSPGYRKDTCDIVEEILILEVSLLADFVDGFQEQVLTPWPLMLKQNNYVAQSHIISAVCESSELQGQKWHGEGQERYITLKKYIGLISLTPEQIQNKLFRSTFHSALTYTFKIDWKIPGKIPDSLQWLIREVWIQTSLIFWDIILSLIFWDKSYLLCPKPTQIEEKKKINPPPPPPPPPKKEKNWPSTNTFRWEGLEAEPFTPSCTTDIRPCSFRTPAIHIKSYRHVSCSP